MRGPVPVLVAASGAAWEADVLQRLRGATPAVVLLKRCVDLSDLLATAATGQARAALVSGDLPGLDADSISTLVRAGVGVVMVNGGGLEQHTRAQRMGIRRILDDTDLGTLPDALRSAGLDASAAATVPAASVPESAEPGGKVLTVWGPAGAPGRTTVAVNVAAELARRGHSTFLLDADPYGGTVAQHLGVLDEISGLLAAARLANVGRLDGEGLVGLARQVAPGLRLLTGLPRADRWTEVRAAAFTGLLQGACGVDEHVVIDTGFNLESEPDLLEGPVQRNGMTLAALEDADEVLVVGAADPIGMARLARALVELRGRGVDAPLRVVVNRSRASLGWKEAELRSLLDDFAVGAAGVHLLPDDRAAVDRALVAGRALGECGDSPLLRALRGLVDCLTGERPARRRSLLGRGRGRRSSR